MAKEAVFTMKLEPELRDAFMAEAQASDRPASQVVRELMREFVKTRQAARDYETFLHGKVAKARLSIEAGVGRSQDEVEADFAARRARVLADE
jgi:predicted transcriptional regulator